MNSAEPDDKADSDAAAERSLGETCPLEECGLLGYCYYSWVSPFLWKALQIDRASSTLKESDKKSIDHTSVFQNPSFLNPNDLADAFEKSYAAGGLRQALLTVMSGYVLKATIVQASSSSLLVFIPLFVDRLLRSIKADSWNISWIVGLTAAIAFALLLKSVLENMNVFLTFLGANRFQLGMIGAIQRKALRLSAASRQKFGGGVGINIIGVDPLRMFNVLGYLPYVLVCPYHVTLAFAVLSFYVGWSVMAGVTAIVLFFPLQFLVVKYTARFRKQLNSLSDERLKLTQEALTGVRVLKYFAWEHVFLGRIETLRRAELGRVRLLLLLSAISNGLVFWLPIFGGSAIVALHAWRIGSANLDGSLIYTILIMMNYLGTPIYMIPVFASALVAAKAAARRLDEYFQASEAPCHVVEESSETTAVELKAAEFVWETLPPSELGRKKKKNFNKKCPGNTLTTTTTTEYARLESISLDIKRGSFVVIVGPVGSGKSSFLSGLIGDMKLQSGSAKIFTDHSCPSQLAYCPQQAWIMSGTVRDNILFGREFDTRLYALVIDESCLRSDLDQLPNGDQSVIGESGAGLSGGQKQRLSFARALYAQAGLYLLDDPLSAVDPAVARRILQDSLLRKNGLLKGCTRILVTHQIGLMSDFGASIDMLIVMKGCKISYAGPFKKEKLKGSEVVIEESSADESTVEVIVKSSTLSTEEADPSLASTPLPIDSAKELEKSPLPFDSGINKFWLYFNTAGIFWAFLMMAFLLGTEGVKIWRDLFLNRTTGTTQEIPLMKAMAVYTLAGLAQGAIACATGIVYGCVVSFRAGQSVHDGAMRSLMATSMSFFDRIQLGALLERFGSDLSSVDTVLPEKALQVLAVVGSILTSIVMLIASCWATGADSPASIPAWKALPILIGSLLPLIMFITAWWYLFTGGWSPIQGIIGRAASRVTGVFSESLQGLSTLRSLRATKMFADEAAKRTDALGRSVLLALGMRRWVSVRIDLATTALVILTVYLCLWLQLSPKLAGLLMLYSLNTAHLLEWCIKQFAEVESNLNSFDRIAALQNVLQPEEPNMEKSPVDESWPKAGSLLIDSLVLRYRADLPPTLKGLSLNIEAGQKIAIVGRTGAGKSSLIAAIYRMAYTPDSGSITLDGVDIATVPLARLRQRLSIVMQDPVLFSGTLRFNLDPESVHADADLWRVLEATRMHTDVSAHSLKLDMPVEEAGANFSIGQRQLLCLARALLRANAPLLLIDEATANVDFDTDARIQEALRQHLRDRPGTTLITVAHRITTVLDYDRVAVLGNGQLLEFGNPKELLANPKSHFRSMAEKAGIPL